ncbi:hypothetical protein WCD74_16455 [Actinomycetospora sp. OC33-EN08]|uniref:Uncharacterized protein n=1 Tax=Actinomycetospora aurantiaca TaxID=3129233 RepID=A0ABU8MRS3_9PSEU
MPSERPSSSGLLPLLLTVAVVCSGALAAGVGAAGLAAALIAVVPPAGVIVGRTVLLRGGRPVTSADRSGDAGAPDGATGYLPARGQE